MAWEGEAPAEPLFSETRIVLIRLTRRFALPSPFPRERGWGD